MSKKSKKTKKNPKNTFTTLDVTFKEDDLMLPTVATAIQPRRDRGGFGSSRDSYGSNRYNNNNNAGPSESDTGVWRRGPSQPQNSNSSNSFTANRSGNRDNFSRASFGSNRSPNNSSFNSNNNSRASFGSNRIEDNNASESDNNWRGGKKKEQPKFENKVGLNSSSSNSNINPWAASNGSKDIGRGAFGSKKVSQTVNTGTNDSFSRNSFGNRDRDRDRDRPERPERPQREYGGSKFGGRSKFGGNSGASTSKFNTGGGFGATALKNIDNGTTRLSYATNNRFSAMLDDTKQSNSAAAVAYEAPVKTTNSRFGNMNSDERKPSNEASEQTAFPGLGSAKGPKQRQERTLEQLKKTYNNEVKKEQIKIAKQNKEQMLKQSETNKKNVKKNKAKSKSPLQSQSQSQTLPKSVTKKNGKLQSQTPPKNKENVPRKVDKKLVRKFNKDCLGQNKSIEINNDTEKLIIFGLSQKENILKRNGENYEKIANLLVNVIFNERNVRSGKRRIDLDSIYDIIYNQTQLIEASKQFIALVLEILSLIEVKMSALTVVYMCESGALLDKYLAALPNVQSKKCMKEFEEYGLQYLYPLQQNIVTQVKTMCTEGSGAQMIDLCKYLKQCRHKQIVYGNYYTIELVLEYVLNKFYFCQISDNEEENEAIAKKLMIDSNAKQKTKTVFSQLISLLECKSDDEDKSDESDEEDMDEEEDEDEDIDGHSLLILSNIITLSATKKNNFSGLISLLKVMELSGLITYKTVQKFVQCESDKYTQQRLNALAKLSTWISELDERQARIQMEKDNDNFEDDNVDNTYAGNLLAPRQHKTASDYETISFVE